jgi:hypothetical protein
MEFLYVVFEAGASARPEDMIVRRDGKGYLYIVSGHLGIKNWLSDVYVDRGRLSLVACRSTLSALDNRH